MLQKITLSKVPKIDLHSNPHGHKLTNLNEGLSYMNIFALCLFLWLLSPLLPFSHHLAYCDPSKAKITFSLFPQKDDENEVFVPFDLSDEPPFSTTASTPFPPPEPTASENSLDQTVGLDAMDCSFEWNLFFEYAQQCAQYGTRFSLTRDVPLIHQIGSNMLFPFQSLKSTLFYLGMCSEEAHELASAVFFDGFIESLVKIRSKASSLISNSHSSPTNLSNSNQIKITNFINNLNYALNKYNENRRNRRF